MQKQSENDRQFDNDMASIKAEFERLEAEIETLKEENAPLHGEVIFLRSVKSELETLNDRLRSECHVPLTWTKTKPTEAGWYWRHTGVNKKSDWGPWIAHIGHSTIGETETGKMFLLRNGGTVCPVEHCDGEWAGPIPEPGEYGDIPPEAIKNFWNRHGVGVPLENDCCKRWKGKKFHCEWEDKAFCPECGKKL